MTPDQLARVDELATLDKITLAVRLMKAEQQLQAPRSENAPIIPRAFALRCRSAVAHWVMKCERDEDNTTYPEHYKPVLKEAADKARQLLADIDEAAGL